MNVAFLVNDLQLSGGVGVVVQHARQLARRHGMPTALVLVRDEEAPSWGYDALPELDVLTLAEARERHFDVAVATWWETAFSLFEVPADRHAYFVQSLEDRFYPRDQAERLGAAMTLDLPVSFITEARWIRDTLRQLRPDAPVHYVRNGIDKATFPSPERVDVRERGPLRILVEGDPRVWFKGVREAARSVAAMREPHHLTLVSPTREDLVGIVADDVVGPLTHREMADLYARSDVLLKLSSVEGMYGPPLEGFHMGATCVTTPVTGHDEYVEHGWNALVCEWDDVQGTARQLDLLAHDRRLLHFLRTNALTTARGWPSWEQQGQLMALALRRVRGEEPPGADTTAAAMLADLRGGVEVHRGLLSERIEFGRQVQRIERVKALPPLRQARGVWRSPRVQRSVGPWLLRVARRLLGR